MIRKILTYTFVTLGVAFLGLIIIDRIVPDSAVTAKVPVVQPAQVADALPAPGPASMSCTLPDNTTVQACTTVTKMVPGSNPTLQMTFDTSKAQTIPNSLQDIAVLYAVQIAPGSMNNEMSLFLSHGDDMISRDLNDKTPVHFWAVSHDGGKTWGQLASDAKDGDHF